MEHPSAQLLNAEIMPLIGIKKSCDLETANQNTLPKWNTTMLLQNQFMALAPEHNKDHFRSVR